MATTRQIAAVFAAGMVLLLAGCSSDNSGGGQESSRSGRSAVAQPTGPPIKLLLNYTSVGSEAAPEAIEGAKAAAKAINDRGGIGNRPIVVDECDNHADPNQAKACGEKAVSGGYAATIGNIAQQSFAYLPILAEAKIAALGQTLATPSDMTSPASFPFTGGAVSNFLGAGRFLGDDGAKRVTIVRSGVSAGDQLKGMVDKGLAPLQLTVQNDVSVPPTAVDMSSYVVAALANKADGLILALTPQQAIGVIQGAKQINPDVKIVLQSLGRDQIIEALGPVTDGIIMAEDLIPVDVATSGNAQFKDDMAAAGFEKVSGLRSWGWLSVQLFAEAARNIPDVTAPAVFDALNSSQVLKSALTPPIQFAKGGILGLPRVFTSCSYATKVEDGKQVKVTGKFFDPIANAECETPS
jgi:ABC-type branched-subunit amino acid transport system substrate-binding protein